MDFAAWLDDMRAALRGERDSHVPCDGCTACCTSSQFVRIGPEEVDALAHIPRALLFPAPLAESGTMVMGYDEQGHCPMLVDGACSIYEHRPRTCRTYDCRVFTATGVEPDRVAIAARVQQWRFAFATDADGRAHDALCAAARDVQDPINATERAIVAIGMENGDHGL